MADKLNIFATPLLFPDQTQPHGFLSPEMGCQACWYYYILAHKMMNLANEEHQIVLEGEPWHYTRFRALKKSIALIYGLESPAEADKFWELVRREAKRLDMPAPDQSYVNASPLILLGNDQSRIIN
jgi:hypothetical protein